MDDIARIRVQIDKIPSLEKASPYGADYQLWEKAIEISARNLFGDEGIKLFRQQQSVVIHLDPEKQKRQYISDLAKKKQILEGLLSDISTYSRLKEEQAEVASTLMQVPSPVLSWENFRRLIRETTFQIFCGVLILICAYILFQMLGFHW